MGEYVDAPEREIDDLEIVLGAYPAALKKFQQASGSKRPQTFPMALTSWSQVLAPMRRRWAFSFERAISMGVKGVSEAIRWDRFSPERAEPRIRSGERAGRTGNRQPCAARIPADPGLSCVEKLSRIATAPQKRRGQMCFDMDVEGGPVHAPSIARGAVHIAGEPGDEGPRLPSAERGCPEQPLTDGATAPQADHVRLHRRSVHCPAGDCVAICREGMKTSRCALFRMKGWRRVVQSCRAGPIS